MSNDPCIGCKSLIKTPVIGTAVVKSVTIN